MAHRVTFRGVNRTVEALDGENLLTLARRHGLHLDSSCGGNGSCHQCRVVIHSGTPIREGKPAVARHRRGDQPVYLACQCEVRGDMVVEHAPVHGLGAEVKRASLEGWFANGGGKALQVLDTGAFTGALYEVSAEGEFDAGTAFRSDQPPEAPGAIQLGRNLDFATALALGTRHVTAGPRTVLDFAGRLVVCGGNGTRVRPAPTGAFGGGMPHLPGAIESVAWSPLKTRTIVSTVAGARPAGLCASGLMSCVLALLQAGMCDAELQLSESRFTRRREDGSLEALLVAPDSEAQSPHGEIYASAHPVSVPQAQLNTTHVAARTMAAMLQGLPGPLITTGDFGTYVPAELLHALGVWQGPIDFVPHAAALGAARWAIGNR
ncbi:MAG: 2Fe-2S iron-sulfur cluster binding domain-containing protein [Planctomycetes bacterium]|nr:2Fe-2S iron-sulfur cluster binding domain-containing protein [Planctomycetota bacterium]